MAKDILLFAPFDIYSHYIRCLTLADAIKDDFDIWFVSSRHQKSDELVRQNGYSLLTCQSIDADSMVEESANVEHSWLSRENLAPLIADQVRAVEELKPALIINDFSITFKIVSELTHTPCCALISGHLCQYYKPLRKPPHQHPAVRFFKRLKVPQTIITLIASVVGPFIYRQMVAGVNEIRKEHGLPLASSYFGELECQHNLISDVPAVAPTRNLPSHIEYIGPVFNSFDAPEDDLLARLDKAKPTVICTLGTRKMESQDGLHQLLNYPGFRQYNVIIAGPDPDEILDPAIIAKPFINLSAVFPHCDVAIIHGGDGTLYQCFEGGVAILGMPGHGEQVWSLQKAELLGLGEEIPPDISAETLVSRVAYWTKRRRETLPKFRELSGSIDLNDTKKRFRDAILRISQSQKR